MSPDPDPSSPAASNAPDAFRAADESLPPALLADLSALYPAPRVPAAVDRRVLNDAAAAYAGQARHRRWLRWGGAGAAAAAAVLVVAVILHRPSGSMSVTYTHSAGVSPPPRLPTGMPGDVDGDGRVDILDAFGLARKVRDAGGRPLLANPVEDVNGDGVVDERDVNLIAHRAVTVADQSTAGVGDRPVR